MNKNPESRLSAVEALKEPFILQAERSPVTPRNSKLNSSFELETKETQRKRTNSAGKYASSFGEAHENVINNDLWY